MWEACFKAQGWQGQVRNTADKRPPAPAPPPTKITHEHYNDKHSLVGIYQLYPGMGGRSGLGGPCAQHSLRGSPPHPDQAPQTVLTGSSVSEWCWGMRSPAPGDGWSLQDGTELTQGC